MDSPGHYLLIALTQGGDPTVTLAVAALQRPPRRGKGERYEDTVAVAKTSDS